MPVTDAMPTPDGLRERLFNAGYIADEDLASLIWMGLSLERPLLLEGEAGVGKTAIAGACARALGRPLLRLQCYEGLDLNQAVYEWNYSRQLLEIRLAEAGQGDKARLRDNLFSEEFLLERPLLQAIRSPEPCVLLIDEIDRADEAFEAFLLEMLSEYQVTVPEIGTLKARSTPLVILTSNGTRDLSDALRRRCLFHYVDFPTLAREMQIVHTLVPEAARRLVEEAVAFVQRLRKEDLDKTPGVAETLDWVRVLFKLGHGELPVEPQALVPTLAALLKTRNDRWQVTAERVGKLIDGPRIAQDVGIAGMQ
ncbi:MAG: MoxR family ATPase [Gammaproteobacteria bacterium]|nr:MoxR family ATPase [Gammaproteobacteria bacterium]MBU0786282.1 MoxR family ATPase [Gammaproteobacteria bacterium]MBU0814498.1 MoxR family ATPase [Gammaproteobacteria bacterium]MBU1786659.1 MoxR family ATPase [Gammaproteobacteria bacterium]